MVGAGFLRQPSGMVRNTLASTYSSWRTVPARSSVTLPNPATSTGAMLGACTGLSAKITEFFQKMSSIRSSMGRVSCAAFLPRGWNSAGMRRWYGDGIVVLGDGAHAMSPQLGQGVNFALLDASCLAACLTAYPLPVALVHYQRCRRLALFYYQLATRWLTPWFQSNHECLSPIRRGFFRS